MKKATTIIMTASVNGWLMYDGHRDECLCGR